MDGRVLAPRCSYKPVVSWTSATLGIIQNLSFSVQICQQGLNCNFATSIHSIMLHFSTAGVLLCKLCDYRGCSCSA